MEANAPRYGYHLNLSGHILTTRSFVFRLKIDRSLQSARRRTFTISFGAALETSTQKSLSIYAHVGARDLELIRTFTVTTTPDW